MSISAGIFRPPHSGWTGNSGKIEVIMLVMFSPVEFIVHHYLIVLLTLYALATLVFVLIRRPVRPEKAANWPVTEATIQSVGRVAVDAGRQSYSVDVGDFSYNVNDEY